VSGVRPERHHRELVVDEVSGKGGHGGCRHPHLLPPHRPGDVDDQHDRPARAHPFPHDDVGVVGNGPFREHLDRAVEVDVVGAVAVGDARELPGSPLGAGIAGAAPDRQPPRDPLSHHRHLAIRFALLHQIVHIAEGGPALGDEDTLATRGLGQVTSAAVGDVEVDDQWAARSRLVERGGFSELFRAATQRLEATALVRAGQRDRVVDV
jgi:hypothetical protein